MIKALAQGIIGGGQQTLGPSVRALGPNRYLGDRTFLAMLLVALIVHIAGLVIASFIPPKPVTDIPVRALSFKLGDGERVAAYAPPVAAPSTAEPMITGQWSAPEPALLPPPVLAIPAPAAPAANRHVADTPPAIASSPQRFIREVGAAPAGTVDSKSTATAVLTPANAQPIREGYAQQISTWIERHKLYPAAAAGRQGTGAVRVRIDRMGYVRYYALEQSSRNPILDAAAVDTIRRANPFPAVPADYPAGALIEFLIPITFRAPQ